MFKSYNKDNIILNNITFNIEEGEIFGIIGNTGAGKSTILRMINGYISPNSGNIKIFNQEINDKTKKSLVKDTSMIFQNYNLLKNLTVLDNVLLPTKLRKMDQKESLNEAIKLLGFVDLENKKDEYIKTLSGGEKQRVAIARSLITNPKILLLDEPTSALDRNISIDILNIIKKINEKHNTTIVIISHDIETIKSVANKVLILEEGKISKILKLKKKDLKPLNYEERLLDD